MSRTHLLSGGIISIAASLVMAIFGQFAHAAFTPMSSGVTIAANLDVTVTGLTVPSGKAFPALVTANTGAHITSNPNTSGEVFFLHTANNLDLNTVATSTPFAPINFLAANGYGYADLTNFGGNAFVKARDNDPAHHDFVLAELGGNDDFSIAAIMPNGNQGQRIFLPSSTFGHIQFVDPFTNANFAQRHGFIAFDITDLKDVQGNNLSSSAAIKGVRVFENQLPDPFVILQRLDLIFFAGDLTTIPEPATALLLGLTSMLVVCQRRRM